MARSLARERQPGDRVSVVVLPRGEMGARLLEVVRTWVVNGLLAPSLWVDPERVQVVPARAPVVPAWHLGPWGAQEEDLFDVLGRRQRQLVRVVVAQLLDCADAVDPDQLRIAGQVLAKVRESVPDRVRLDRDVYGGTEVRSLNVIAGVSGLSGVPETVTSGGWDVNVVTSPEDRRDPSRANVFVRSPGNLVPVAAATIATVTGLYAGVEEGPFDGLRADRSLAFGKVIVVRATVRALLGERIVEDVARQAVVAALAEGGPAVTDPEQYAVSLDPARLVERALGWTDRADQAALSFRPEQAPDQQARTRVTLAHGVLTFLRFSGEALVSVVLTVYGWLVRRAERAATAAITGLRSGIDITLRPSVAASLGAEAAALDERDRSEVARRIAAAEATVVPGPTPLLWSSIRALLQGLLDGVGLPEGFEAPVDGTRRVVLDRPAAVGPRPDDSFTVSEAAAALCELEPGVARVIGPLDAEGHRVWVEAMAVGRAKVATGLAQLDRELAEATEALAELDGPEGEDERRSLAQRRFEEVQQAQAVVAEQARALDAEHAELERWYQRRATSYLWRLKENLVGRVRRADEEQQRLRAHVLSAATIDAEEPVRLHRRFVRRVLLWVGFVLATTYPFARWVLPWVDGVGAPSRVAWALWGMLVGLWLLLVLRAYYQGVLAFLRRFRSFLSTRQAELQRLLNVVRELGRLRVADRQLDQWAVVLGWSLHLPWSDQVPAPGEQRTGVDPNLLPASMRLAEPTLRDEHERLGAVALGVAALTRPGWRARAFLDLVKAHDRSEDAAEVEQAVTRLDADETPETGPLSSFRSALDAGDPQQRVLQRALVCAEEELRAKHLGKSQLSVTLDRADNQAEADLPADQFLAQVLVAASSLAKEMWTAAALADGVHAQPETVLWLPPELVDSAPQEATVFELGSDGLEHEALVKVAVRVDLTRPLEAMSLQLFLRSEAVASPSSDGDQGRFL